MTTAAERERDYERDENARLGARLAVAERERDVALTEFDDFQNAVGVAVGITDPTELDRARIAARVERLRIERDALAARLATVSEAARAYSRLAGDQIESAIALRLALDIATKEERT